MFCCRRTTNLHIAFHFPMQFNVIVSTSQKKYSRTERRKNVTLILLILLRSLRSLFTSILKPIAAALTSALPFSLYKWLLILPFLDCVLLKLSRITLKWRFHFFSFFMPFSLFFFSGCFPAVFQIHKNWIFCLWNSESVVFAFCLCAVCTELMRVFVFIFPYKILYWTVPLGFAKYNNSLSALAFPLNLVHRCFHSNNTYLSPPNGISTAVSWVCV